MKKNINKQQATDQLNKNICEMFDKIGQEIIDVHIAADETKIKSVFVEKIIADRVEKLSTTIKKCKTQNERDYLLLVVKIVLMLRSKIIESGKLKDVKPYCELVKLNVTNPEGGK